MPEKATYHWEMEPSVQYYPDTQTLHIENGRPLTEGEDIAKGITVFYAKAPGEPDECEVSGITIEWAEHLLKPFVDAILAKYGVEPQQRVDASKAKTQ